jgi:hypothetical protein
MATPSARVALRLEARDLVAAHGDPTAPARAAPAPPRPATHKRVRCTVLPPVWRDWVRFERVEESGF